MRAFAIAGGWLLMVGMAGAVLAAEPDPEHALVLHQRSRVEHPPGSGQFEVAWNVVRWDARKTAIVICDMWNQHWCKGATARVAEMAPRMNELVKAARRRGVLVIHAPSGTMDAYKDTPQRKLAQQAPTVEPKVALKGWCRLDPQREPPLPIDDSDGGCDDEPRCPSGHSWTRQIETLEIHEGDAISDSAEVYYLLQQRGIENLIVMGVHTNMCVLGRPFGIRQMVYQGKNVVLVRDMTDTMYNSRRPPHVSHFRGTDLVIEHIEKHWCPTITSSDLLGGAAFRFKDDKRPHVVFVSHEDEYQSEKTLPRVAQRLADRHGYACTMLVGHGDRGVPGLEELATADVLVLYARRKSLPKEQMAMLRAYLEAGKPLVALRTSSHAFAIRGALPPGHEQWATFDGDVLGGNYHGHGPNQLGADVSIAPEAAGHPILAGVAPAAWHSQGSLYYASPIDPRATVLLRGSAGGKTEPVAWTRTYQGGRVFYTSLGHADDFSQAPFQTLLSNAISWAMKGAESKR